MKLINPFTFFPALKKVYSEFNRVVKPALPELTRLCETGDADAERALIQKTAGDWAVGVSRALKINYEIEGEENIPEAGPVMVYANHQSLLDIVAMFYLFGRHFQVGFIAKEEWRKVDALRTGIEASRSVFLVRNNPREALKAVAEAGELLNNGYSLIIFPEGTRSRGHEMGEFKTASFKFAEKGKVPILPISIDGTYRIFEEHNNVKYGQTVKLVIHPLVHTETMAKDERKSAFVDIETTIREGLHGCCQLQQQGT